VLSQELEFCLNDAFASAREARHEFMTVEHLLLAIVDTPKVREVLKSCGADTAKLKTELKQFIDQTTPRLAAGEDRDVQPTLGFQRVLQRAVFHVQSSGKKEVTVANVLVAIFSEKQSHAAYLLSMQDVSRLDVVNSSPTVYPRPAGRSAASAKTAVRPAMPSATARGAVVPSRSTPRI